MSVDGVAERTTLTGGPVALSSRSRFVEVQRARLVAAMANAACSCGAGNVTVKDVVVTAGVSRRTFYELFADGSDCLMATIEHALECLVRCVGDAYDSELPWRERVRACLEAFLTFLDEEPTLGRLLIVETLCAGPRALARRASALAPVMDEIDSVRQESRPEGLSPLTAEGLVGAVLAVLHARMLSDQHEPLLTLASPLTAMIVLPYLGVEASHEELSRPTVRLAGRNPAAAHANSLMELPMRLTYRTMAVLGAVASDPGSSNLQVGGLAGVTDPGQISKLLRRLERLGLVANERDRELRGVPNAWSLTPLGREIQQSAGAWR
jgi:AcrR family transcriptional regulator